MGPRTIQATLFLGMTALSSVAFADSYGPFTNYRAVDPTGRYYVVMKRNDNHGNDMRHVTVAYEIVERRPGSAPVAEVSDPFTFESGPGAKPRTELAKVREGDLVLGKGSLDRAPRMIVISSSGLGFVGIDVYADNLDDLGNGHSMVVVSTDGVVRHRKNLADLFTPVEVGGFFRSSGSVNWVGFQWIDERRKEVVVVSSPSGLFFRRFLYRTVDMETGKVRNASPDVVLTALAEGNRGALRDALELAAELKLVRAKPYLAKLLTDQTIPLASRLRAAVALGALGDHQGGELVREAALGKSESRDYAVRNLPIVLGDDAAVVLCEVIMQGDENTAMIVVAAMREVSVEAAIPPLIALLREGRSDCIDSVIYCLEGKEAGAKAAIPDLIKLLDTEPTTEKPLWTQQIAADTLGKIGPDSAAALPALIRLAQQHAPEEWNRVKDQTPKHVNPFDRKERLSNDYFVDAILRIRRQ